jgi:hypothetical protein
MLAKWERPGQSAQRASPQCASRRPPFDGPRSAPPCHYGPSWRLHGGRNLRDRHAVYGHQCDGTVLRANALALDKASNIEHIPRCTNEPRHLTKTANPDFLRLWRVQFSMGCGPPGTNGRMLFWGRSMLDPRDFRLRSVVWIVLAAISVAAALRYVLHAYGGISGEDIRLNALLGAAVLGAALMATFFYRVRRR